MQDNQEHEGDTDTNERNTLGLNTTSHQEMRMACPAVTTMPDDPARASSMTTSARILMLPALSLRLPFIEVGHRCAAGRHGHRLCRNGDTSHALAPSRASRLELSMTEPPNRSILWACAAGTFALLASLPAQAEGGTPQQRWRACRMQ